MPDQVSINLNELRNVVDAGLRTRRYLDYWESSEWADAASPIVDAFDGFVTNSPSQELVELIQRALGYMVKVILHADDSNGEIGGLISDLLEFHGVACDAGVAEPVKLARWMVRFTIDDQDFFVLDPKRYANALGETGLTAYRKEVGRRREAGRPSLRCDISTNAWPCSMAMSRGSSSSLVVIREAVPVHPGD